MGKKDKMNTEIAFLLEFKPWLLERNQCDLYNPNYPDTFALFHGAASMCDGFFFPPIITNE